LIALELFASVSVLAGIVIGNAALPVADLGLGLEFDVTVEVGDRFLELRHLEVNVTTPLNALGVVLVEFDELVQIPDGVGELAHVFVDGRTQGESVCVLRVLGDRLAGELDRVVVLFVLERFPGGLHQVIRLRIRA
jgi:hypothetical protein